MTFARYYVIGLVIVYQIKGRFGQKERLVMKYTQCKKCVMDTTDPNIRFDDNGICNHCREYDKIIKEYVLTGEEGSRKLQELVHQIKQAGQGKEYDCFLGISGGIDSSYTAYLAKQLGLRALLLSCDNGFDPPATGENVSNIAKSLGFTLMKYKFDQEEFNDLWLSFFRAGVINLEAVTDHLLGAALYQVAEKHGLKYIVNGANHVTEATMPTAWGWDNNDRANLLGIHKAFGKVPIKTLPLLGHRKWLWYTFMQGTKIVSPLNYVGYNKEEAKRTLMTACSYKDYGMKHHESVLTRFYQCYILPQRWEIDKRKAHLSCLICAGQISRQEALEALKEPPYDPEVLKEDKKLIFTILGIDEAELQKLMTLPKRQHEQFGSDRKSDPMISVALKLAGSMPSMLRHGLMSLGFKTGSLLRKIRQR